jgi:hypothetical protein
MAIVISRPFSCLLLGKSYRNTALLTFCDILSSISGSLGHLGSPPMGAVSALFQISSTILPFFFPPSLFALGLNGKVPGFVPRTLLAREKRLEMRVQM